MVQWLEYPTAVIQVSVEVRVQSLAQCSGIGHSCSLDSVPGWEFPYATGVAIKIKKKKKLRFKILYLRVPVMAQWLTNPSRNHEVVGSIPGLAQWVKDLALHELWYRSQMQLGSCVAVALV